MACWVYQDSILDDDAAIQSLKEAWEQQSNKDELKIDLQSLERQYWLGTEVERRGCYDFPGETWARDMSFTVPLAPPHTAYKRSCSNKHTHRGREHNCALCKGVDSKPRSVLRNITPRRAQPSASTSGLPHTCVSTLPRTCARFHARERRLPSTYARSRACVRDDDMAHVSAYDT
jgi:hypothetical protein